MLNTFATAALLALGFALLILGIVCAVLENGLWAYFLVPGATLVLVLLGHVQLRAPSHDLY